MGFSQGNWRQFGQCLPLSQSLGARWALVINFQFKFPCLIKNTHVAISVLIHHDLLLLTYSASEVKAEKLIRKAYL